MLSSMARKQTNKKQPQINQTTSSNNNNNSKKKKRKTKQREFIEMKNLVEKMKRKA